MTHEHKHAPFTAGPLSAPITLVGQAPGRDEAARGGAFIGPAGKALSRFCSSAGINKESCRLENVFQFFPAGDDLDAYLKLGTKLAKETPTYQEHLEALRQRLLLTSSNVIVSLGALSTYALTGIVGGIGKWRGSVLPSTLLPGRKIIPTYHPASTLKGDYINGYYIVYDLQRAKIEAGYPEIHRLSRDLLLSPTFFEACSFLDDCQQASRISYDIETRGYHLSHISFALSSTRAMCLPLVDGSTDVWSPEEEAELLLRIARLLEDDRVEKVGQNLSFDCTFLYHHYGINVRPVQDTMIAAAILYPDFPKRLDFLVSLYCDGEPYYKDDGKVWKKGLAQDELTFRRYNAMDSAVLHQIFPRQVLELQRQHNWEAYCEQRDLIHPLVYAGHRGLLVDVKGMKDAASNCEKQVSTLASTLRSIIGPDVNYNSNKQLLNYFYVLRGVKPYMKRRGSGDSTPTVDEKALTRLASHGLQEASLILQIRKLEKARSTYFQMEVDPDSRIRCSFNPVGTVQARISSSKSIWGSGGNLQNQTDEMLSLFLADPGGIYLCFDMAQAENRCVAYEAQEATMIQALEQGVDIHSLTGSLIHDCAIEKVTKEIRDDGKVANHCKLASCEVLTSKGWCSIAQAYQENMAIAQWNTDESISFVCPTHWYKSSYTGEIYTFTGAHIHQSVTKDHRIPCRKRQGRKKNSIRVFKASDMKLTSTWEWPTSGYRKDGHWDLSDLYIRLLIAFQADGSWNYRSPRWRLKNPRKIQRLKGLFLALDIHFSERSSGEYTCLQILASDLHREFLWLFFPRHKMWSWEFIHLTEQGIATFCDEIVRWDGDGNCYWTSIGHNSEIVQTILHIGGYKSLISLLNNDSIHRVSKIDKSETRLDTLQRLITNVENVDVYCPTVPTGFFLCRENGIISVTGNSLNFGLGVDNFILRYALEWERGKFIHARYHAVYPGIREWHARTKEELSRNNRVLVNCYGRARRFLDPWGADLFEKAYNYRPQSTVATKMNNDGVKFVYYHQNLFSAVEFANTVHDSLWLWIPLSVGFREITETAARVREQLETPLTVHGRTFSIPVDVKIGFSLDEKKMLEWKAAKVDLAPANWDNLTEELERYVSTATRRLA